MPVYLILPLIAAVGYAIASMFLKKALAEGAHPGWCFHINNFSGMVCFLPMILFQKTPVHWEQWHHPALNGALFFAGCWFTFAAMQRGHVSLVTPLMGSKVIFAAIGLVVLIGGGMSGLLWAAALLTTLGILLMGLTDMHSAPGKRLAGPVSMALISSALFASTDVLIMKWGPDFGRQAFLTMQMLTSGLLSLAVCTFSRSLPKLVWTPALRWAVLGSSLVGVQSLFMGSALGFFDDPVGVNVVYATRGLWSLFIVAWLGPLIGNHERHQSGNGYALRVVGALLLLTAVVFAILGRTA
ncbi:MAG: EamA family transporter [Verrucomicrobiaceae bacterium]